MTADLPAGSFVDLSTKESVSLSAGAVADVWSNWHDIDWRSIHQTVRRLQARIVKATKEGSPRQLSLRIETASGDTGVNPCLSRVQ